jgi:hypothetical protein
MVLEVRLSSNICSHCLKYLLGDHTSFLTFPADVHERVVSRIGSNFVVDSYLYPTYPAVRPLAHATKQLLSWYALILYICVCAEY